MKLKHVIPTIGVMALLALGMSNCDGGAAGESGGNTGGTQQKTHSPDGACPSVEICKPLLQQSRQIIYNGDRTRAMEKDMAFDKSLGRSWRERVGSYHENERYSVYNSDGNGGGSTGTYGHGYFHGPCFNAADRKAAEDAVRALGF